MRGGLHHQPRRIVSENSTAVGADPLGRRRKRGGTWAYSRAFALGTGR